MGSSNSKENLWSKEKKLRLLSSRSRTRRRDGGEKAEVPAGKGRFGPADCGYAGGRAGGERGSRGDSLREGVDRLAQFGVFLEQQGDLIHSVQDSGVILPAERAADLQQGGGGKLAGEVHGDLAWEGDGPRSGFRLEVRQLDAEEVGHLPQDLFEGNDPLVFAPEVREDILGEVGGHLPTGQRAEGDHAREGALKLADVGLDAAGDQVGHIVREAHALDAGLLFQNGHPRLEVGGLDVGDEPPLEARAEALLDLWDLLGRAVAGDDDLLARVVEVVEGVEELLLGALLAGDELDVVDQQEVDGPVLGAELRGAIVADGVDEVVGEALRGEVEHIKAGEEAGDLMADGVEEVGLAQADPAVDEERVVRLAGQFGPGLAGRLGELVDRKST